jgi:tetratricopeptide (TPR) repeat protein
MFYSELGFIEESLFYLNKALELNPENIEAYYVLSTSGKVTFKPEVLDKLNLKITSNFGLTPDQRTKLHFIMAIQLERLGDLDRSFDFFKSGNQHRYRLMNDSGLNFEHKLHYQQIQNYKGTFNKAFFEKWGKYNFKFSSKAPSPIFILGMPRSGSTLIEQIISVHSEVVAGGELAIIGSFIEDFISKTGDGEQFPKSAERLDLNQIIKWSNKFFDELHTFSSGQAYVIDKTPFNFSHLWLIQIICPNAKIIHCKRDPRDVGLSCFQQNFTQEYAWSCDLAHIGHYINAYHDLMKFWDANLKLSILNIRYEDFIQNTEGNCREIINFLGLEWQNGMLDLNTKNSRVRTASKWQVREPVYNSSSGRWKKQEKHLLPLINVLNTF